MTEAQVYIVRVWNAGSGLGGFRAAVRAVEQEESRVFTRAEELGPFFVAALAGATPAVASEAPPSADTRGANR